MQGTEIAERRSFSLTLVTDDNRSTTPRRLNRPRTPLMGDLVIRQAKLIGHHTIIAGIDADQAASIAFHARHGFAEVGHLRQVGFKFGRWLDVIYMQLVLA